MRRRQEETLTQQMPNNETPKRPPKELRKALGQLFPSNRPEFVVPVKNQAAVVEPIKKQADVPIKKLDKTNIVNKQTVTSSSQLQSRLPKHKVTPLRLTDRLRKENIPLPAAIAAPAAAAAAPQASKNSRRQTKGTTGKTGTAPTAAGTAAPDKPVVSNPQNSQQTAQNRQGGSRYNLRPRIRINYNVSSRRRPSREVAQQQPLDNIEEEKVVRPPPQKQQRVRHHSTSTPSLVDNDSDDTLYGVEYRMPETIFERVRA